MKRRFVKLAVALTVSSMLLACGKKSQDADLPKPDPTPLFKPAMSYWNFEKAQHEFGYKSWDTLEDRKPLVSDKRPPFRMLIISVPNFQDHGFTGDLVLTFYNDRLMKTQYYLPKVKDYVAVAGADKQVGLGSDLSGSIAPHTHVWIGKEADGRTYLGMEDEILKQQMDDWILRYSQAG